VKESSAVAVAPKTQLEHAGAAVIDIFAFACELQEETQNKIQRVETASPSSTSDRCCIGETKKQHTDEVEDLLD
jgi:hypothetical protein